MYENLNICKKNIKKNTCGRMKSPMFTKYTFKLNYSTRALQPWLQKQGENIKNQYLSRYLEIEMYRLRYIWIFRYIYWDVFGYWGTYIEIYLEIEVHILRYIWILRFIYWDVFWYWGTYIEIYLDIQHIYWDVFGYWGTYIEIYLDI